MSSTETSSSIVSIRKKVYWRVPIQNITHSVLSQYETGKYIRSEVFSISNGNEKSTEWYLNLCPNGNQEEFKLNVGLYLWCKNAKETGFDFKATFKFGVQKDNGEDFIVSTADVRSKEELKKTGYGLPKFLSHEELFKAENGYVAGGKLVVVVELNVKIEVEMEITKSKPKFSLNLTPFADYKKMFENEALSDFALKTKDYKVLKVHKAIIGARSPMFYAMLTTDMEETKQGFADVPDFDSRIMKEVLRFIYCNQVEGLSEIAPKLVYAAEKYQIEDLKQICLQEMTSSLQVGNAVKILEIAYQVGDTEELYEKCLNSIVNNYSKVSNEPSWKKLPKELLFEIIDSMVARFNILRI